MEIRLARIPVVLVSGKIGAGKTTLAASLVQVAIEGGLRAEKISFASKIKELSLEMGWDGKKDEKGRRLLQSIGFAGREYDINLWVKFAIDTMRSSYSEFVVIDDWRFTNEYDFFTTINSCVPYKVRVLRRERKEYGVPLLDNDISEVSLPDDYNYYNFVINNDTSLDQLDWDLTLMFSNIIKDKRCLWE
jgi:hypothetical protein